MSGQCHEGAKMKTLNTEKNELLKHKPNDLKKLNILKSQDEAKFYSYGIGKKVEVPFACIHHGFDNYVLTQPNEVAVEFEGKKLTYKELDDKANLVAKNLVKNGVKAGDNVGLFLSRSFELVTGILGVLKVGAAYVPQDARIVPKEQLEYIKNQAKIKTILTIQSYRENIPRSENVVYLDDLKETSEPLVIARGDESDNCFVLFTSGTTGKPNGVQVTHKNLVNILLTTPGNLGITPGTKVSQILNISFDMSAWEILGCLANGGTLLIRGKSIQETVEKANVVIATPTILSGLDSSSCLNLRTVAVAGEPCPKQVADIWSLKARFYNCCGPTETTIVNTMHEYTGSQHPISIGGPTPNNSVYILDDDLKPLPIGEVGEMWAGGDCVSAGYIGNEDLTEERYKDDPFLGGKMFKTRDLGRWNENGELEHFGRTDDQVKIRGFRVELDSVSSVLESISGLTRAATIKLNDRDLASFVACTSFDKAEIYKKLNKKLQYYCVPAILIAMDKLPMTDRGKIDKKKLIQLAVTEYDQTKTINGSFSYAI